MQLSDKVLTVIAAEHISPEELHYMVSHSAVTRIRTCNRRYFLWVFRLVGDVLQDMQYADVVGLGRGGDRMLESHEGCQGAGCRACGWIGQVARSVEDTTAKSLDCS